MIKVGSDFSGVGSFDQALKRLNIEYETMFACDIDKYARQTYLDNYGKPKQFPMDVNNREIPKKPLTIYMSSPPCQTFSIAGKRGGENDQRGILFYNSHEFIKKNKPRYFIFENVKGLCSDDNGKTFRRWCDLLGGKSVNGNPVIFPHEQSVPYHIYYKVLNAKNYNVPQNRERIFIVGIRNDDDNHFSFPKNEYLTKKFKQVLEKKVDNKYFLSEHLIRNITFKKHKSGEIANLNTGGERGSVYGLESEFMSCLTATDYKQPKQIWVADYRNDEGLRIRKDNISPCMTTRRHSETDLSTMPALVGYTLECKYDLNTCSNLLIDLHIPDLCNTCTDKNNYEHKDNFKSIGFGNSTIDDIDDLSINQKVRRLTPRECFRLMDFPEDFKWSVSDTQAYKQAGNSIVVNVLYKIIKKLNL